MTSDSPGIFVSMTSPYDYDPAPSPEIGDDADKKMETGAEFDEKVKLLHQVTSSEWWRHAASNSHGVQGEHNQNGRSVKMRPTMK